MLTEYVIQAFSTVVLYLLDLIPSGSPLTFPSWLIVPSWIAKVDLIVPFWTVVLGPFLTVVTVVAPPMILARLALFVYHQFWGSN